MKRRIQQILATQSAAHWAARFEGKDVCCSVVASLQEAMANPHFHQRGLFSRELASGDAQITALPVPVAPQFRSQQRREAYPALGEANAQFGLDQ